MTQALVFAFIQHLIGALISKRQSWMLYCFVIFLVLVILPPDSQPHFFWRFLMVPLIHCAQTLIMPSYRQHMQRIDRFGLLKMNNRLMMFQYAFFDTQLGALPVALFFVVPVPLQLILVFIIAIVCGNYCCNRQSGIVRFYEQRFLPLVILQEWFLSHPVYDTSIHTVLDPIIRELFGTSTYWPLQTWDGDDFESILQLASDWVFVEQHAHVHATLNQFVPADIVTLILHFTNIPVGNNQKRRTNMLNEMDQLIAFQQNHLFVEQYDISNCLTRFFCDLNK